MYCVYLGLGSNIGDRAGHLSRAVEELGAVATVDTISSIYETVPVEMETEESFFNMAVGISTTDDPPLLLRKLKKIEKQMGRKLPSHMEPRVIDIDILLYRGLAYQDHMVRVPHPKLEFRRFALEPLNEIAPTALHPLLEKTVAWLLRGCHDNHRVTKTEYHIDFVH